MRRQSRHILLILGTNHRPTSDRRSERAWIRRRQKESGRPALPSGTGTSVETPPGAEASRCSSPIIRHHSSSGLRALRDGLAVSRLPHRSLGREGPAEPPRESAGHQRDPSDAPKPDLRRRRPMERRGARGNPPVARLPRAVRQGPDGPGRAFLRRGAELEARSLPEGHACLRRVQLEDVLRGGQEPLRLLPLRRAEHQTHALFAGALRPRGGARARGRGSL